MNAEPRIGMGRGFPGEQAAISGAVPGPIQRLSVRETQFFFSCIVEV